MKLDVDLHDRTHANASVEVVPKLRFVTKDVHSLADKIKIEVPAEFAQVRVLDDAGLSKNMIQGTIDEIRPTLTKEALRQPLPVALIGDNGARFSMVIAHRRKGSCVTQGGKPGVEILAIYTIKPNASETYPTYQSAHCEAVVE